MKKKKKITRESQKKNPTGFGFSKQRLPDGRVDDVEAVAERREPGVEPGVNGRGICQRVPHLNLRLWSSWLQQHTLFEYSLF